ncbi:LuxR C-terminal-related transcriptional regulator [Dasania sp. GY-MA-18]|uniref:LuxR C-terminal-related transcriptional regulator n=1 Tax=Dasania phycosphaerae TaxID=2950436 RepID=A0A9J6RKW8_9GAMM|nr:MULTISPECIES: helix-turn-helix transcriptional regulator [Dasania]MCR8922638.1 LuxR C-terminal-related transcriptional regulator [Dasania sp. GY-MA-18]MCZ0865068.1 LuxR C-terminal-related transcriptional regulator [Dasania phycosphaerae]MCZ0868794.1 LuxR C-terminal-related transcriptional regulator [Dasania phycosphaerae]
MSTVKNQHDDLSTSSSAGTNLSNWPDVVAPLITAVNTEDFPKVLFECINRIAPIDSAIVMLYRPDEKPFLLYDGLHPSETVFFEESYMAGAYLLSPLYRLFPSMRSGFYQLSALEPLSFENSEFGRAYFNDSGLCDDANFLLKITDDTALVASFGRQQMRLPFSAIELQQLHITEPVIRAAMEKHWQGDLTKESGSVASTREVHNQLQTSLHNFGLSLLTEREREVLHLMFEGKASKSAAKALNISPETERGHRKNIYAKLNVASQAELFSLIFTVIGEVSVSDNEDPFVVYSQRIKQ